MKQSTYLSSVEYNFAFLTHIIFHDSPGSAQEASLRQLSVQ